MNIFGKIARYCIQNKRLSLLMTIGLILWGCISFAVMPKQYNPDIVAPAFSINVEFPGATVDEVYQIVTKPLEDILNEIAGVENIYSKSVQGGHAAVVVEFYVGEKLEESMIRLRQKISSRLNLSPLGVGEPYIASIDPEDLPIETLALYSETVDPVTVRKRAFMLRDELKAVAGTAFIDVIGGRQREFQIVLNPAKMKDTKTSIHEIHQALTDTSLLKEMGLIKEQNNYYHIEIQEQAKTVAEIQNIVIISNVDRVLTINDVADVIEGEKEHEEYVSFYTNSLDVPAAVFVSIAKKKGENIIRVAKNVEAKVKELQKRMPELAGITIQTVKDEGAVAQKEIQGLVINLIEAIVIVFIVLFSFLNYRAAIIVAVSVPLTLLTVLAWGNLLHYTINRITLFALILSLGLLVDSATVVIENIVKNKKLFPALPKDQIIPQSVSEVGVGLFLSTATTVLAFIPMTFVTGMMGPYMGPLPFFVSAALLVSLVFSYTLNPWLAYVLCSDKTEFADTTACNFMCRVSTRVTASYQYILSELLRNRRKRISFLIVCLMLLCIVMTFPIIKLVRFRMLPKADREQMFVYIDLDRGTSVERSQTLAIAAAQLLRKESDIVSIQSFVGTPPVLDFNGLFKGVADRRGFYQITLKLNLTPPGARAIKSEQLAVRFRVLLKELLKQYPDARMKIIEDPPGPPVRATLFVKVKSRTPDILATVGYDLEKKMHGIEGVEDIDISLLEQHDKYVLSVNKRSAADAKISVDSIASELETIFSGRIIGVYHSDYNYEQEYIVLKLSRALRDSIEDLNEVYIVNQVGNHVPVSKFVDIQRVSEEDSILADNRERVVYVSGEMEHRSVTYAAIDMLKLLFNYEVPGHQTERTGFSLLKIDYLIDGHIPVTVEVHGEWDLTVKVFRDLGLAMIVAIVLIYLILVAQFNSFLIPLLILGTIPLALIGVMPGFAFMFVVQGLYFSATSMIGVIALSGIVVNNAIIFIEYAMQAASQYDDFQETLIHTGLTRMRPILLTSVTTILGSLVIAMDPVWAGLSWSIVFGLSLSCILTLIVFPVLMYEFLGEKWFRTLKQSVH